MWQKHKPHHMQRYMQQNPYRLLALSFLAVMTVGTLLLMLPIALLWILIITGPCLVRLLWSSLSN